MNDNVENLVLEQLRAIRSDITSIKEDTREIKHRLTRVEEGIAGIRRDGVGTQEDVYRQQSVIDGIKDRIARIEKRLELTEA